MSFDSGAGQAAPYTPPPPPPPAKTRSPWLYVGLGCGLLAVLVMGGCVAAAMFAGRQITEDMKKPINRQETMAALADTPIYPGATFNETGSKAGRASLGLMKRVIPADSTAIAAFVTKDNRETVQGWYDKKMPALGYQPVTGGGANFAGNGQRQYKKDKNMVIVQVQNAKKTEGSTIMLMRFNNIRE